MKVPMFLLLACASCAVSAEVVDFESVEFDAVPAGWTISMTHDGGAPRWVVMRDASAPSGAKVFAQVSNDRASGRFPLAICDGVEMADGRISVKFKPISGRVDQAAGLVWRYRDENNYYVVRANALENNVVLYKLENGRRISLAPIGRRGDYGTKHTVPSTRWSTLSVASKGARFSVSFDGQVLFEVEDATFTEPGGAGLWTKADSVTYFDDFEIVAE